MVSKYALKIFKLNERNKLDYSLEYHEIAFSIGGRKQGSAIIFLYLSLATNSSSDKQNIYALQVKVSITSNIYEPEGRAHLHLPWIWFQDYSLKRVISKYTNIYVFHSVSPSK